MIKRIAPLVALLATMIVLSACGDDAPVLSNNVQAANNPNTMPQQSAITASQAGEMAVEMVGGGDMRRLETAMVNNNMQFIVQVDYDGNIYDVVLDGQSGSFISLRLIEQQDQDQEEATFAQEGNVEVVHIQTPTQNQTQTNPPAEAVTPNYPPHHQVVPEQPHHQTDVQTNTTTSNITIPANIVPRSPARTGGPANPAISAQRAVELARDHLISIGVTNARFDYVYMDIENGIWVWSVEFDGQGRSYEFYVNLETGAFLKSPGGGGSAVAAAPAATPQQPATNPPASNTQGNRPSNPAISLERAIEIGYEELARRGHSGTFRNHSGMDWEPRYGGWVWEIVFRVPGGRLPLVEMYINVHTGSVAKFEWDD